MPRARRLSGDGCASACPQAARRPAPQRRARPLPRAPGPSWASGCASAVVRRRPLVDRLRLGGGRLGNGLGRRLRVGVGTLATAAAPPATALALLRLTLGRAAVGGRRAVGLGGLGLDRGSLARGALLGRALGGLLRPPGSARQRDVGAERGGEHGRVAGQAVAGVLQDAAGTEIGGLHDREQRGAEIEGRGQRHRGDALGSANDVVAALAGQGAGDIAAALVRRGEVAELRVARGAGQSPGPRHHLEVARPRTRRSPSASSSVREPWARSRPRSGPPRPAVRRARTRLRSAGSASQVAERDQAQLAVLALGRAGGEEQHPRLVRDLDVSVSASCCRSSGATRRRGVLGPQLLLVGRQPVGGDLLPVAEDDLAALQRIVGDRHEPVGLADERLGEPAPALPAARRARCDERAGSVDVGVEQAVQR